MTDWTIAAFVIVPSCSFSIIPPFRLGTEKQMRRFDFEAVGVHALPHIENLGLLVGLKVQSLLEEHLDLC